MRYLIPNRYFRINCHINCGLKINPKNSVVVNVTITDENGSIISHNSTNALTYSWYVYEVIDQSRKRRDLSENGPDLVLVENFENFAATGKLELAVYSTGLVAKFKATV